MWRARKIMTSASADTPWATRNGTGTRRTATLAGAPLSDRSSSASAIAQHATHSHVSGTGSCSMVRTTPTKTNKVGAATASRATRFARNCAAVDAGERHRGEHSDQRHREGQRKAHRRTEPRQAKSARTALRDACDAGVEALEGKRGEQRRE